MINDYNVGSKLSIGLMSGTSMDGIDAVLIESNGDDRILPLASLSKAYSSDDITLLKTAEMAVHQAKGNLQLAEQHFSSCLENYLLQVLHFEPTEIPVKLTQLALHIGCSANYTTLSLASVVMHSTLLHCQVVQALLEKAHKQASEIDVIGYHGQTLLHQPLDKLSVIIGDGQMMADRIGIPVVTQFREADLAAGGRGAPFAPLYHLALAKRDHYIPAAVINCGGIANITYIPDADAEHLIGFDTGPGNGLIDRLLRTRSQGTVLYDQDGRYGAQGNVDSFTLDALLAHGVQQGGRNFLKLKPPKALDIHDLKLVSELDMLTTEDACATLEAFTAKTIADSLQLCEVSWPALAIVAGGGRHNPIIMRMLQQYLTPYNVIVRRAEEIGWDGQSLEAEIFAYLAIRSLKGLPLSYPGTTQVPVPLTGGVTYEPTP